MITVFHFFVVVEVNEKFPLNNEQWTPVQISAYNVNFFIRTAINTLLHWNWNWNFTSVERKMKKKKETFFASYYFALELKWIDSVCFLPIKFQVKPLFNHWYFGGFYFFAETFENATKFVKFDLVLFWIWNFILKICSLFRKTEVWRYFKEIQIVFSFKMCAKCKVLHEKCHFSISNSFPNQWTSFNFPAK